MLDFVIDVVIWLIKDVVLEAVGWVLTLFLDLVRGILRRPVILILWAGAFAAMYWAWGAGLHEGSLVAWLVFVGMPALALLVTLEWRDKQAGERGIVRIRP